MQFQKIRKYWLAMFCLLCCSAMAATTTKNTAQNGSSENVVKEEEQDTKVKTSKKLLIKIKELEIDSESIPKSLRSGSGVNSKSDRWLELESQLFLSGQEVLDEFDARWSVIIETDTEKKPVLMTLTVTHKNMKKGAGNEISAFVSSDYFFDNMKSETLNTNRVSAQIEILVNGKVVAKKAEGKNKELFLKKNRKKCIEDNSALLPRSQTPFSKYKKDKFLREK